MAMAAAWYQKLLGYVPGLACRFGYMNMVTADCPGSMLCGHASIVARWQHALPARKHRCPLASRLQTGFASFAAEYPLKFERAIPRLLRLRFLLPIIQAGQQVVGMLICLS